MNGLVAAVDIGRPFDIAARNQEGFVHAGCAGMNVSYLPRIADTGQELVRDEIEIVMPGEHAAFHATYRTADGRLQRVFVRGPHISVIPARQPHALHCQRQSDIVVVGLDQAFFECRAREALGCAAAELVERYAAIDPFMREIGNALRAEFRMLRVPCAAYLEALAVVIAIHVARHYAGAPPVRAYVGLPPHKLRRVQEFVREHFAEAIHLQDLAATARMSPFHFTRMFKKATGQSPHFYITRERIERAKDLLRDSEQPLVDVAANVGFQTQGHFTQVFHRYAGVTPRVFRLKCQGARAGA